MSENRRSNGEWFRLFEEQRRSGRTMLEFCRSKGINFSTFKNKKYAFAKQPREVVELVEITPRPESVKLTIVLLNGRRLEVAEGFNEVQVKRLIAALESC